MNSNLEKALQVRRDQAQARHQQPRNITSAQTIERLTQQCQQKDIEIAGLLVDIAESNTIVSLCTKLNDNLVTQCGYAELE